MKLNPNKYEKYHERFPATLTETATFDSNHDVGVSVDKLDDFLKAPQTTLQCLYDTLNNLTFTSLF